MSDTYDAYSEDDPVDPSSFILRHQRATVASALGSLDADPEQAARAMQLGDATGDHPALIYPNLENYEAQHKAMLTSQLLQSNKFLRQYVDADPMHPKLSSDDYANLDTASEFIKKIVGPNRFSEWLKSESIWKSFMEGFGDQPFGASAFRTQKDIDYAIEHPVQGAIVGGLASVMELVSRPAAGILSVLAEETGSREPAALLEYLMMKGEGPGFKGPHIDLGLLDKLRLSMPGPTKKLGEMAQAIHPWASEGKEPPAGLHSEIDKLKYEQNKIDLDNLDEALKAAQSSATRERNPEVFASFVRQHTNADISISGDAIARLYGDKPPTIDDGLFGWVPRIAEQLEAARATGGDVKIPLADWLAKVDPEVAKEVHDEIRVRPGGITKGEKDRVAEAKKEAEEKQAEIKYNPAILIDGKVYRGINHGDALERAALELKEPPDALIARLGGEGKAFDEANGFVDENGQFVTRTAAYESLKPDTPLPEPLPQVRAASGLEPLFSIGDRKIELRRMPTADLKGDSQARAYAQSAGVNWDNLTEGQREAYREDAADINFHGRSPGFHDFDLLDENGNKVGALNLSEQKGGKQLYVEMIQGGGSKKMYDPNWFGPALMRDLLRQLKAEFPDAESITGHRVSGGRGKSGAWEDFSKSMPVIKLDEDFGPQHSIDLQNIFGEAQKVDIGSSGVEAYYSPLLRRSQQKIDTAIREELARIAPKLKDVFTPNFFDEAGTGGLFGRESGHPPLVVIALDAKDPIGATRHEAIHYLRDGGFFTDAEWTSLERAARDGDWKEKYGIHRRYAELSESEKLEEAIAEGYQSWKAGKEASPKIEGAFQKLKDFFEAIRLRIKEILGKDFTWEELFQKVDEGEIGKREGATSVESSKTAFDISEADDEAKTPKAANDIDANQRGTAATYDSALKGQQIEKLVDKDTERGDTEYWRKIAATEGHNVFDRPNGIRAARAHSEGGKTTLHIASDGRRTIFQDGQKVVREGFKDIRFSKDDINSDAEPTPRPFDRAAAVGMTADQFSRYMKLIEKRHAEDLAAATKRAEAEQAKRQTKEWKENSATVREEVSRDINLRPDVAADLFLGNAEYLGGKLSTRPKLDETKLTPEQKAALPKSYYGKNGLNPDDVGNLFGYPSGQNMVDRLTQYNQVKMAANMSSKDFVTRAIDMETARQMEQRYGSLEKSIVEEAKDQAISETQLNLLHEETLALALRNGAESSIEKGELKSMVQGQFAETPIKAISTDEYLASAGKAGKAAEMALLKQDFAEAFRAKQQQYMSMLWAAEAKGYEKARAKFDKLAKRYEKREVAGATPAYTDGVHDILMRLGQKVRRSVQDLADSFKLNGYDGLKDLVVDKEGQLRDLHTPDWLQDPNFRKPLEELTHSEFEQVHDALKAITHNSRDELKVTKAGEKYDLEQTLGEMIDKIKSLGKPKPYPGEEGAVTKQVKNYWWGGITVESMLNRLDRDDPRGPFYQFITHHFTEAANYKDRLIKDFQKKITAIGKVEDLDKQVENHLFENPETGEPLIIRRRNILGMLQNAGNKNNLMKLAKGYDLETSQVLDFIHQHTTKEDWDRAQKIGDIFNEIFDMANTMSHNISGVGIQRLPLEPLDTPHGTYPGWYNPIKYDQFMPGKSKRLMGPNALEEEGYYRATTPQGYTKQRTGYIAPIELSLDVVPQRMKQMLHDIAMRPAVIQMSKFFYDNRFERAMTNFYGVHQAKSMIPFLRDIANAPNVKSMTEQLGNQAIEYFRQNMIATLIGFNPGTVAKHGTTAWINSMTEVGALNYLREFKNITAETISGRTDWRMAMEKSEELQRRMRNFSELIEGHGREINIKGSNSKFMSLREMTMNAGATPVSISDLLSAVPTWLAEYKTQLAKGTDEGMAVSFANRAIRRAHGSSILSNKPAIARTNALGATFSSLYGFFSHMQQKQYELAWKARDMLTGQRDVSVAAPELMRGMFSYVIAPAIIEELVTPYTNSEHESWGMKAAKTLTMGVSSSFIGVRDFVRAAINVRDPQAGLIGTSIKTGTDLFRDLSKGGQAFTKEKAGNLIKHTFALNGALNGLTNEQEGKIAEYMFNYFNGKERPKGPWDAAVGLRFGKTEHHSRSWEEWKRHTIGK